MPLPVNAIAASAVVKEATQLLHTEVENLLMPKLTSISSTADYAAVLRVFYGYFFPLEQRLQQYLTPEKLPDMASRRKAGAILHDLNAIGYTDESLPVCRQLPRITSVAEAFGALYVMEGSTLGGKMIARMLRKNEALAIADEALTFFSGYGDETGSRWKSFLAALNGQENREEMVAAANETFYYLKRWMQQTLYNEQDPKL